MARATILLSGAVCVALLGCGKKDTPPASGSASTPAPSVTASSVEALPDLQPVPAIVDTNQNTQADADARAVFDRWVAAAAANDPEAWTKAEQEMQTLGATAVPALVAVLEEGPPLAREMAVMFLAQLGPQAEPAAAALAELLDDESALIRVNAAGVLTTFDGAPESVVTTLTALLSDADPNIRTTAAGCLGNIAELAPPAINRLIVSLDDPEPGVRAAAATTLSRSGSKASS
ncbi:MAG: HEAT repeat domain-containing protein, partial [Planctomycetaceae bacterium]|nr:HEAT repeat domain-containing protein [Planctomycetaceae bacterium]